MINLRLSSIQTALVARFVAVATVPLLLFGWFLYVSLIEQQADEIALDLQVHARNISDEVGEFLDELRYELIITRDTVRLLAGRRQSGVDELLQSFVDNTDYFEALYLLDGRGKVTRLGISRQIQVTPADYLGADFSRLEFLAKSPRHLNPESSEFRWSDIFVSPLTGKPAIMLAAGMDEGVILGTISLDRLNPILQRRIRQVEAMNFTLVDQHGALIAHSNPQLALERTNLLMLHPEILGALASGQEVSARLHEDHSLLESVTVIPETGWIVHASIPQQHVGAKVQTLRQNLASATAGAAVLGSLLAFWLARRLIRPLNELRQGAQVLAAGEVTSFQTSGKGYREIAELARHLHDMAGTVLERESFLRASEERYRSVVVNLGEGLLVVQLDGKIVDCNPSAERILGRARQDLLNQPIFGDLARIYREDGSQVGPEDYPVKASLQQGAIVENRLLMMKRQDGLEVWLQINSRPQLNSDGSIAAVVISFTDVTSLKLIEDSLRRSKERFEELYQQFQALLEGIADRISLVSRSMHILWTNQEAGSGCIADEALSEGDCCYQQFFGRAEPCPDCPVERCFVTAEMVADEKVDPAGRIWNMRAFPVLSTHGETEVNQVVLMAEEITDKRSNEQRQMRANQLAALGELAAGVAHEINNPISGVINYAQLIVNTTPEESREHDLARRIIKEGDRIAKIVRELLIFARSETQESQVLSWREILGETLTLCEAALRKEQIHLHIDLPPGLPLVESRSHQLQQLLLNLLVNARHALAEKYPGADDDKILKIGGEPISVAGRPFVRIRVRDHGSGIPAEILHKVMNPFYTTKPAGVGTGLGLSISFEIAKRHGGSLQLFSEHGQWTEAVVELPAAGQG